MHARPLLYAFLIIMIFPATAIAGGGGPACDTEVALQASLPDGTVTFKAHSQSVVTVTVKHWAESGTYYSAASTTIPLQPHVKAADGTTDTVTLTVPGKSPITLQGRTGFETVLKMGQIDNFVTHTLDEGHVGFRVNLQWEYANQPGKRAQRYRYASLDSSPYGLGGRPLLTRNEQSDRTSKREGYQWYQSPLIAATVDWKATVRNVLRCKRTLIVALRTANPPLSGPTKHAGR